MFSKEIYVARRAELKRRVGSGLVLLFGNNEAPYNYPANAYTPFRQDSTFVYYFGIHRDGLIGVIDIDADTETLLGDDVDIEDIVWLGTVGLMKDLAASVGVEHTAEYKKVFTLVASALSQGQAIHFLPPYRHDTQLLLMDLLGVHPTQQKGQASQKLIMAVVAQRAKKGPEEIAVMDAASDVGYEMHCKALRLCRPGVKETVIAGQIDGMAYSLAGALSFATICSQHGEIMHGTPYPVPLEEGRLLLVDAGCELDDYCSDNTRTLPVSGTFSTQQREIYDIVADCHDYALSLARPGVKWWDVHFAICRRITSRLVALGLMKGNVDDAVAAGAHTLFLPHGLGHMLGMDSHDMENLGQIYVGFDEEVLPHLDEFGTNALRMGRRLQEGFVVSDEPGIYFIPALIDDWQAQGLHKDFINYPALAAYRTFGGVRIEDAVLITATGSRYVGTKRIPYVPSDLEVYMAENKETL